MMWPALAFDEKEVAVYCGFKVIFLVGGSRKTVCGRTIPFPRGQLFQEGFLASGLSYSQRLLTRRSNGVMLLSSPVTVAGPLRLEPHSAPLKQGQLWFHTYYLVNFMSRKNGDARYHNFRRCRTARVYKSLASVCQQK